MQRLISIRFWLCLLISISLIVPAGVAFAAQSVMPSPSKVFITNNLAPTSDTVVVTGLAAGDVVKVYASSSATTALGQATVAAGQTSATVTIAQIGSGSGTVYITVTSTANSESNRTVKSFLAEPVSTPPYTSNITISNNPTGTSDTIIVQSLVAGDIVKVYADAITSTVMGTATVASGATKATVTIPQLGAVEGAIYVTVTSSGKGESGRTYKSYVEEPVTSSPLISNIKVTNNLAGTTDSVTVAGVAPGDVIKLYADQVTSTALVTGTVSAGATSITLNYAQLGANGGNIYVTVTTSPKLESSRVSKAFSSEPVSSAPDVSSITVQNNSGSTDSILVTGLKVGDVVKIYSDNITTTTMGTGTVAAGASSVSISISQVGATGGSIYVSVTSTGKTESSRTRKLFNADPATVGPSVNQVIVTNNAAGTSDTIVVTGLNAADIVKVYADAATAATLGTATVAAGNTSATVTISQIGQFGGTLYVSVTRGSSNESIRLAKTFSSETSSDPLASSSVTITNNTVGINDVIQVSNLKPGQVITAYATATSTSSVATATVAAGNSSVSLTVSQLGTGAGYVYLTVSTPGKVESRRIAKAYSAEGGSNPPDRNNIFIQNNVSTASTVTVTGLSSGDVVKVYADSATSSTLGTATVTTGNTSATVSVGALNQSYGVLYVSVTSGVKAESNRTAKIYAAQAQTAMPLISSVMVTNNVGVADTIVVSGLSVGDVVKVYADQGTSTILALAAVTSGSSSVTLSITQIGSSAGYIYITNTTSGKLESSRLKVNVPAE